MHQMLFGGQALLQPMLRPGEEEGIKGGKGKGDKNEGGERKKEKGKESCATVFSKVDDYSVE